MTKLPKINDKRIEEIEDGALDDGRFFVHLKPGYSWDDARYERRATQSFDSRKAAMAALKWVSPVAKEGV